MNKFLKDAGFYQVESAKNARWYQKEYELVGLFNAQIQHAFINIGQRVPYQGKFYFTVKKFLDGKIIKYILNLEDGQGRNDGTQAITEYQIKSLLINWENSLRQYNIYEHN